MNTKILVTLFVLTFLAACNKDKYTSKPQLRIKSVSTKELHPGETITFKIEVTDAEGDIQDSIWVQRFVPRCSNSDFTAAYKMPTFTTTKDLKGEIQVCYGYGINLGCPILPGPGCNSNDSTTFKFWIRDKAKNTSDTISSEQIVITR
jgi:hypothetical protein